MAMLLMTPRKLQRVVTEDPVLSALWDRTLRLRELQKLYIPCVPTYLRNVSRVGAVTGDELRLFADSGAAATRLRQLAPGLLAEFRSKGWQFTSIRVAVQVKSYTQPAPLTAPKRLDTRGRQALDDLAEKLPASPLQDAVRRLSKLR